MFMEMIQILAKLNAQEPALFLKPRQPYRINQPSDFKLPRSMLQELTGMFQQLCFEGKRSTPPAIAGSSPSRGSYVVLHRP